MDSGLYPRGYGKTRRIFSTRDNTVSLLLQQYGSCYCVENSMEGGKGDVTKLLWYFRGKIGSWQQGGGFTDERMHEPGGTEEVGLEDLALSCIKGERKVLMILGVWDS